MKHHVMRIFPVVLLACIAAPLLLSGCIGPKAFKKETTAIEADIREVYQAHEEALARSKGNVKGDTCGFAELAKAEAELDFASYEFDMGFTLRASEHLESAKDRALEAKRRASAWEDGLRCLPPDRDRDSILDDVDKCPDDPEDLDKFEDGDGCPDPDNDKDGILDKDDQCPDDPEDLDKFEDEDGCPDPDNDKDEILDAKDQCPNKPEDVDTFQDEDGCPDPDNDKDGVCDQWVAAQNKQDQFATLCTGSDQCPMEAETFNGFEDEDGCPERDSDGDDIIDPKDQCPTDPETYNGYEDEDGCPDAIPAKKYSFIVVTDKRIELKQKIFFATGLATIQSRSFRLLDEVADALKENKAVHVRIEGHTDSRGSAKINERLSQNRAESVKKYLAGKGVETSRMETKGYGPSRPISSNKTRIGREKNRRVEFHLVTE